MALYKPKQLKQKPIEQNTETFVTNGAVDYQVQDLTVLSLDDLADRYAQIDQQSQLMKGLILLEARNRFTSNNEFGNWVKTVQTLCLDRQEVRTRYMNFARYFKNKEMLGISLTAAYEISAPANEAVADKIYEYALNKNLSVAEIKKQIQIEKGLSLEENETETVAVESILLPLEDLDIFKQVVLFDIEGLSDQNAIRVLQDCIKAIQGKKKNNKQHIPASEDTGNNS